MLDLIAVGELLIDFTPMKSEGITGFTPNPGGAPCNFLTMASHVGLRTAFLGKVGADTFGQQLKAVLQGEGIDTSGLILSETEGTTLAFVHLNEAGERSFSFYRKGCADTMLKREEINFALIEEARALHFGSLSFTDEPSRSTVYSVLEYAKAKGLFITYDPNYRPALWREAKEAKEYMLSGLKYAHILKVSEEELFLLTEEIDSVTEKINMQTEEKNLKKACEALFAPPLKLILVTLGEKGAYYFMNGRSGYVTAFRAEVKDTTGAGDAFFGGFIGKLLSENPIEEDINPFEEDLNRIPTSRLEKVIDRISTPQLEEAISFGNAAASLCVEAYGGIPAMPSLEQVYNRI